MNEDSGQRFIVHDNKAYAVTYDKDNGTFRVVDPANPARPSYAVRQNPYTQAWEYNGNTGLKGGGDTDSSRIAQERRQELVRMQKYVHQQVAHLSHQDLALQYQQREVIRSEEEARQRVRVREGAVHQVQLEVDVARFRVLQGDANMRPQVEALERKLRDWQSELQGAVQDLSQREQAALRFADQRSQLLAQVQQRVREGDDLERELQMLRQRYPQ